MADNMTIDELAGVIKGEFDKVEERFDKVEKRLDSLDKKIELRPTLKQIMDWGDERIVPLEVDLDKVKYLHRKEFEKLPPPAEISRSLIERGLKKQHN